MDGEVSVMFHECCTLSVCKKHSLHPPLAPTISRAKAFQSSLADKRATATTSRQTAGRRGATYTMRERLKKPARGGRREGLPLRFGLFPLEKGEACCCWCCARMWEFLLPLPKRYPAARMPEEIKVNMKVLAIMTNIP